MAELGSTTNLNQASETFKQRNGNEKNGNGGSTGASGTASAVPSAASAASSVTGQQQHAHQKSANSSEIPKSAIKKTPKVITEETVSLNQKALIVG